jgi:DNA-binding NarL/FixJ family response regulator
MAATAARILIVDDHPVVRLGVRQLIDAAPDLSVVAEAESRQGALEAARASRPDLAIVDLSLEHGVGLDLVRELRTTMPEMRVLVLSMHDEALYAERALRAGAQGYIMKAAAITGLLAAIREVLAGRLYVSGRMSQTILESLRRSVAPGGHLGSLTDRELEVFELIGRGLGTAAIAEKLGVSAKTVETHRANIKAKLNLRDINELLRFAVSWSEER